MTELQNAEVSFSDGEIIFREGDASEAAYVLLRGKVDLIKKRGKSDVTLATLGHGEMFGETGIFDMSAHSATARARGDILVQVIPRDAFLDSLKARPEAALSVMGKLVERLRAADERLAHNDPTSPPATSGAPNTPVQGAPENRFIDRLFRLGQRKGPQPIDVRVARLDGDLDGSHTRKLVAALAKYRTLRVKAINETIAMGPAGDDFASHLNKVANDARSWLAQTNADLLIWGAVPDPGATLHLRFVAATPEDENRAGCFGLATRLNLPVNFDRMLANVLYAVVLATLAVKPGDAGNPAESALPGAFEDAVRVLEDMPQGMTPGEQAAVLLCLANIAAIMATTGGGDMIQVARHAYGKALHFMRRDDGPYDWAMAQRNLGIVLQTLGERSDDTESFEEAATTYNAALEVLDRDAFPALWATTNNRLGEVYYHLDHAAADSELLKRALTCFQQAAAVISRAERPVLWADIKNNFAATALLLGELNHNREALEKAIQACQGALEVRVGSANLLPWATTQNNLGSACFLLAKLTRDKNMSARSIEAFRQAQDVYRAQNAARMVAVTEKNLMRAAELLESIAPSRIPKMRWESDGA
jgi:CRP-like cAMP-binding protein